MSLILDALNRADQERSVENHAPNLQSAHMSPTASHNAVRRWIIEAVIIGSALLIGVYLYSRDNTPEPSVNSVKPAATVSEVEAAQIEPSLTIKTVPNKPLAAAPNRVNTTPVKPQPRVNSDSKVINSLYQQSSTENTTRPANKPQVPTLTKPNPVASKVDNTQAILLSIPLLSEQSQSFQRAIPSIEYSVHAYAEQGGFVILNGRQFRVGGALTPELRVIAILEHSLVLDYNGRQFRLLALNSWINL